MFQMVFMFENSGRRVLEVKGRKICQTKDSIPKILLKTSTQEIRKMPGRMMPGRIRHRKYRIRQKTRLRIPPIIPKADIFTAQRI